MLKVKDGDLDKLGLLFERYNRILFTFFFRMNYEAELSEDLVQNVFLRILKYKHAFKGDGEFKTWMFHIARNINNDHYKKSRKLGNKEDIDRWTDRLTDQVRIDDQRQKEENLGKLGVAMSMLSEDKREIINLSKIEGMKYKDIGELMNCSEGAVKVKVFRALNDLKEIYSKTYLHHE